MLQVLDPRGVAEEVSFAPAPRLVTLSGKRLGILDNTKHNGDLLFKTIADQLAGEDGAKLSLSLMKDIPSVPGTPEHYVELAAACDFVLTGPGDCASCTSWSCHDAIEIEKRGVPIVMVCSTSFEPLARLQNQTLGMPDLGMAIIPAPVGGISAAEITAKAVALTPTVRELLLAGVAGDGTDK